MTYNDDFSMIGIVTDWKFWCKIKIIMYIKFEEKKELIKAIKKHKNEKYKKVVVVKLYTYLYILYY